MAAMGVGRGGCGPLTHGVRRKRTVGIISSSGPGAPRSTLWQRVKAASVGLRPDGTFEKAAGRTTGIPDYFTSANGVKEPALVALELLVGQSADGCGPFRCVYHGSEYC